MTEPVSARHDVDDARLLNMVRAGDSDAFGVLQERHEAAARRLARHLVAFPDEVDDVVADAFAWVLDVTRRGGGPSNAVRPYVLTALRRVCYYRLTGQPSWQRTDDRLLPEPGEPFVEPSMAGLETALIARAYLSLPERWRAVLWHAQVEQARPADVAPLLGLTRNGVAALNRRATEGLRQAYVQHHLSSSHAPECRLVAERLSVFVRDPHAVADAAMVSAHLDGCDDCRAVGAGLADVTGTLRAVMAPLVLGTAAAAYLFGPGDSRTAATTSYGRHEAQAAVAVGQIPAGGLIAGGRVATAAIRRIARGSWRRARSARGVTAMAGVAVVGAIALTVALTGNGSTPTSARRPAHPSAAAAAEPTVSPTVQPSPSPSVSPSPSISQPVAAAPPAPPTSTLTASLDVPGGLMFGHAELLLFQVANTGSVATGTVTVSISLPTGSSVFGEAPGGAGGFAGQDDSQHGGSADGDAATAFGPGGWDCQPTVAGATCTRPAIPAGQQAEGVLVVSLNGSAACGQPARLTVTAGQAFAQATQDLRC
ncbi:MAG: hypothetical protein WBH47_22980 [Streptosporangiaceae bacterium]